MSAFSIVTWNASTNASKRVASSTNTFDFQAVRIGADTLTISQTGSGGSAAFNFNSRKLSGVTDGALSSDAATVGQMTAAIDLAVVTGGRLKEAVLVETQISDSLGIRAAAAFYLSAVAADGDSFIIKNNSNTETWTFASVNGANQPAFGASAAQSMQNLAARITTDSTIWGAVWVPTLLASMNAGGIVVIYEKNTAAGTSSSRFYGTFATASSAQAVFYNTLSEYKTNAAAIELPATDPAAGRFGFRRTLLNLLNGEIHYSHDTDSLKSWDADGGTWLTLSSGGLPDGTAASGGGIKGKLTVDSDFGLAVSGGVLSAKTDGEGLGFSAGNLAILLNGGTLEKSGSGLRVADAGITAAQLATSVAGNGLSGGGGTALAVIAQDGIRVGVSGVSADYTEQLTNDNAGSITVRQIVYEKSNGNVDLAVATNAALISAKLGVVHDASIGTGVTGAIVVRPGARVGGFTGLTPGAAVYVSRSSAGAVTQDLSDFVAGEQVVRVGHAVSSTAIIFQPAHVIEL